MCSFYLFKLHVWCHQDISMVNYHASANRERQCTKSKVVTSKICLCETSCFKSLANIFFTFLFTFKWCFNEVFKINSWQLFCVDFILLLINCCSSLFYTWFVTHTWPGVLPFKQIVQNVVWVVLITIWVCALQIFYPEHLHFLIPSFSVNQFGFKWAQIGW